MAIPKSHALLALSGLAAISVPTVALTVFSQKEKINPSRSEEKNSSLLKDVSSETNIGKTIKSSGKMIQLKRDLCGLFEGDTKFKACPISLCSNTQLKPMDKCSYLSTHGNNVTKNKTNENEKLSAGKEFFKNVEGIAEGIIQKSN